MSSEIRQLALYEQSAILHTGERIPLTDKRVGEYLAELHAGGHPILCPDGKLTWTDVRKVYPEGFTVHGFEFVAHDARGTGNWGRLMAVPVRKRGVGRRERP